MMRPVGMAAGSSRYKAPPDSDGVRIETGGVRGTVWVLAAGLLALGATLLVTLRSGGRHIADEDRARVDQPASVASDESTGAGAVAADRPGAGAIHAVPRIVAAGQRHDAAMQPPAADAASAAPDAEQEPAHSVANEDPDPYGSGLPGIAVFPPPGTKPIKRGIIVPDDFELPPGYVRHYQTTDDGQQLPPILMYHPDFQPVDAQGLPVAVPADRVVPPDQAPSGLPVQMLSPPADAAGADSAPGGGGSADDAAE